MSQLSEHYYDVINEWCDPESHAAFQDCAADPDFGFDYELLALDLELTLYTPPGYSVLDDETLTLLAWLAGA